MADEGVVLAPDGTIVFAFGADDVYTLRRPKIGEYKKLRERLMELASRDEATLRAWRKAVAAANSTLDDDGVGAAIDPSPGLELELSVIEWWGDVFAVLSDRPLPPGDEVPVWLTEPTLASEVTAHWRTRPAGPFVPPAPAG